MLFNSNHRTIFFSILSTHKTNPFPRIKRHLHPLRIDDAISVNFVTLFSRIKLSFALSLHNRTKDTTWIGSMRTSVEWVFVMKGRVEHGKHSAVWRVFSCVNGKEKCLYDLIIFFSIFPRCCLHCSLKPFEHCIIFTSLWLLPTAIQTRRYIVWGDERENVFRERII